MMTVNYIQVKNIKERVKMMKEIRHWNVQCIIIKLID
jgi:hypothetical protein